MHTIRGAAAGPNRNRKSVSLANVYSCFGSISNAFYLHTVMAGACSSTPYRVHAHSTKRCGYRMRLSAPCISDLTNMTSSNKPLVVVTENQG